MHGFAFNVNTDLNYFNYINPCGFTDREVTSFSRELGKAMNMEKVKSELKYFLGEIFNIEWKNGTLGDDE
jgi:lipoyl(octanoyl) transferase